MKKRILSAFIAVLMVVLLLPVQAFAATEEIKGGYVNQGFETVIGTVVGAKTFSKSGNIPDGLKLSGSWSYKNAYGDYVLKMIISGKPTKAGTYNFSVSYNKEDGTVVKRIDYTMTIGQKAPFDFITSIRVDKWPNKTEYYLGDSIDLTGMKVSAVAYNYDAELNVFVPSEIDVTDLCWVEPAVFTSDEAQNVDVYMKAPGDQDGNVKTFSDHFRVSFKYANPNDILRMEIYQKPTKLSYTVGETLDTTGMTVRLHKGDGSAQDITSGFKTDVSTLTEVGTKTVTVTYENNGKQFTATFDVTVTEKVIESSSSAVEVPSSSSSSVPESSSESSSESSMVEIPSESSSESSMAEVSSESSSESSNEIEVIGNNGNNSNSKSSGIPFWVWIIVGLLVILIAAAVALFLIGRKHLDE